MLKQAIAVKFDLHLRSAVRDQFRDVASEMRSWQTQTRIQDDEVKKIREAIAFFDHTTESDGLTIAGVDGSGDFPLLSYADSFIYLAIAQGVIYQSDRLCGLRETAPNLEPTFQVVWLPEEKQVSDRVLDRAFSQLVGLNMLDVIQTSDYKDLKARTSSKRISSPQLLSDLIRPHASDAANLAIQLRSTAEFAAAYQILQGETRPKYLLVDTTFSLPLVSAPTNSLFYEHLKRLCCVQARLHSVGFFALSKSHGLPAMELLETIVQGQQGLSAGQKAEHWYLRIPDPNRDGWTLSLPEGRRIPPPGAVSYLVKFHRTTPVMRIDMDLGYWEQFVQGRSDAETAANEQGIFEDLDYACHDQRVYGYPYPLKAAHDRASLTQTERVAFRKQLIAEAVQQGMSPSLFRDPSQVTGHR